MTMTFDENAITNVVVVGEDETAGVGSRAVETLPQSILDAQSAEVDVVAGATMSSNAILSAAKECIQLASGTTLDTNVTLVPGTYTGSATGYFKAHPVEVSVTVDEEGITGIVIEEGHDETYGMVQSVTQNLLPRMIEYNSVTVDGITGATATSNAVKLAAAEALDQALAAAGREDLSAAEVFDGQVPQSGETLTLDTDVVIIGLGGSGLAALASTTQAAEGELNVIALEKAGIYGGTSQLTCDVFAMNPTEFKNERNNGEDYQDPEEMREAYLAYTTNDEGVQKAKVEMVDLLFNESGNTLDWLVSYCGFQFLDPVGGFTEADHYVTKFQLSNGYSMETRVESSNYYKAMVERAESLGAQCYFETEAYELLTDETGAVTGVKARNLVDGTEYVINAKAVISATGGFAGSQEMMAEYIDSEYFPFDGGWGVVGSTQNDGKIIQSAIDIGAATYNINMPPEWHNAATPVLLSSQEVIASEDPNDTHNMFLPQAYSLNDLPTILGSSANVLQVNKLGERFNAESIQFRGPNSGNIFYGIQSQASLDAIAENGLTSQRYSGFVNIGGWYLNEPIPELYDIVEEAIDLGICFRADTLEELEALLDMPEGSLTATVERYNELCEAGVDEDFGKDPMYLEAISEEGPYYAVAIQEYIYNTLGGLDVNEDLAVLNEAGEPIPGLYAVGNDCTGVLFTNENVYPSYGGIDMSWCYTSGRLAGANVAEYVSNLS